MWPALEGLFSRNKSSKTNILEPDRKALRGSIIKVRLQCPPWLSIKSPAHHVFDCQRVGHWRLPSSFWVPINFQSLVIRPTKLWHWMMHLHTSLIKVAAKVNISSNSHKMKTTKIKFFIIWHIKIDYASTSVCVLHIEINPIKNISRNALLGHLLLYKRVNI